LDAYKIYRQIINCNIDRRTNFVELSIAHKSPIFAEELVSLIVRELNLLQRERDMVESQSSLEYLYNQFDEVQDIDIKLSINQLIEGQLKTQMLAKVRTYYILQPIDMPYIPREKSSPSRSRIVVVATIFGLLAGVIFVVGRHFFFNSEKKVNTQ
jgi:LPS O-antigen subunit length determinant protein (WzzB/FepE family)